MDEETGKILHEINSLNAWQKPDLKLRTDAKYGHIPPGMQPFRHIEPAKRHFLEQLEYAGPGRAIPEPEDVKTVKIGFIGPITPTVSVATGGKSHEEVLGNKMLHGAQLAIEEANAKGGYLKRKLPFELIVDNDNGLWGSSGNTIIKHAYVDNAWAILGSIDGANSHIAIRVALKAEIVVMNSGDLDPTFIETNIPWVMRCIGDDRQGCYLLARYLYLVRKFDKVGIIRASNRYGRFGVRQLRDSSRRLQHPIPIEMAYKVGSDDFSLHLERIKQSGVDAVVHWGDDVEGAKILNQMRAMGMKQPFFACDRCVSDEFVKIAGKNAEGVLCTFPWDPTRKAPGLDAFREAYRKRFHEEAETYAAHAYDGMNMLIWAIQTAGLNRAKIRDVLAYRTKPWKGVTGDIEFSAVLDDLGEVFLAKYEKDAWKYCSAKDLGVPAEVPSPTPTPKPASAPAPAVAQ
jgi:ABC-type branched-subunit amino acid transport system substrate-binding protein